MKTIILGAFLLFSSILNVASIPVPLDLHLPAPLPAHFSPAEHTMLTAAKDEVNRQIDAMEHLLASPATPAQEAILKDCFGDHYDLAEIKAAVPRLKSAVLTVTDVKDMAIGAAVKAKTSNGGTAAATIRFGPAFYDPAMLSANGRSGTLLHEASHYVLGTWDYFTHPDKGPIQKTEYSQQKAAGGKPLSGYMPEDYKDLKAGGFQGMHTNADTWKAFGYQALYSKAHPNMDPSTYKPNGVAPAGKRP